MTVSIIKKLAVSAVAVTVLSAAFLVGCGVGGNAALLGRWVPEGGGSAPSGFPDDIELFKDGAGVAEGMSISWKVENKRILFTTPTIGFAYDYSISGSKLTLTDNSNQSVTYVKVSTNANKSVGAGKGKTIMEETARIIRSFESAYMAAMSEGSDITSLDQLILDRPITDSEWFKYELSGATLTATAKGGIGNFARGQTLSTTVNQSTDSDGYLRYSVTRTTSNCAVVKKMIPDFAKEKGFICN